MGARRGKAADHGAAARAACGARRSLAAKTRLASIVLSGLVLVVAANMAEAACKEYLASGWVTVGNARRHLMALPAYDQCIKASHVFNLLDARGVISVTERQSYILRVRELAKACGEAWLATEAGGA